MECQQPESIARFGGIDEYPAGTFDWQFRACGLFSHHGQTGRCRYARQASAYGASIVIAAVGACGCIDLGGRSESRRSSPVSDKQPIASPPRESAEESRLESPKSAGRQSLEPTPESYV